MKYTIDTKKSLFEPLELVVDGVTYKSLEILDHEYLKKSNELNRATIEDYNVDASLELIELTFPGLTREKTKTIDIRVRREIAEFVSEALIHPQKKEKAKKKTK